MDNEDILADSLAFLGGDPVVDDDVFTYGPLRLTVAPKEGKASTLLADHVFSPGLFLAERIERGLIDERGRSVLELGAGTGLPSLLLASLPAPAAPALVVLTDHPDPTILGNLKRNVLANQSGFAHGCKVGCAGSLLAEGKQGYDTLILSDLLHFYDAHGALVSSITSLLARSPDARVHVGAGTYTPARTLKHFFALARSAGLTFRAVPKEEGWMGTMRVGTLDLEGLGVRKGAVGYWVGGWAEVGEV